MTGAGAGRGGGAAGPGARPLAADEHAAAGSDAGARRAGMGRQVPAAGKRWWTTLAKLALTVAATALILRGAGIGLAEAGAADWSLVRLRAGPIALSVTLLAFTFLIASALWSRILPTFGERRVGLTEGAAMLVVANLGRYVPGKVAQLAGMAILARRRGMSGVRTTAAAVTAQIVNLLAAAAVGGWVVVQAGEAIQRQDVALWLAILAALTAFLKLGGVGMLLRWALARSGDAGPPPNPEGLRLLTLFPGYLVHWIAHGVAFVLLARGLGMELGFVFGATAFAAAYFAGYAALVAPGGIGIREGALAALLAPVLGVEAGVVLAVLQRAWATAVELCCAAAGALVLRRPATP